MLIALRMSASDPKRTLRNYDPQKTDGTGFVGRPGGTRAQPCDRERIMKLS
jgi:hypothetical protein